MEETEILEPCLSTKVEEGSDEFLQLLQSLPKEKNACGNIVYQYKGLWCPQEQIKSIWNFQKQFQARDGDLIIATMPKSGTTWLKALIFSIVNRSKSPLDQSQLLSFNPHMLFLVVEYSFEEHCINPNLDEIPSPRIFSTHLHYNGIPSSFLDSASRIIYLCRNPLDQFVSNWHYAVQNHFERAEELTIEEAFEWYCRGLFQPWEPFWENILGYWNASKSNPEKVLFIKYEDLKADTFHFVKRIAEFSGFPFSPEEEKSGLIEEIIRLCSFQNLRNLEVNKNGAMQTALVKVKNSTFFRKGEVGDWENYLTPSMADRLQKLMAEKFGDSGLNFELCSELSSHHRPFSKS